jgi:TetR/AcrR family tetracycline transcriptional repressor
MSLDRESILRHAFDVLNESGPDSLTLRRLAERLGVQAPAIYWHFKNKQDLLDEMGTRVMREAAAEGLLMDQSEGWENWARNYGEGLRRTLLRYREGARMFSGTAATDLRLFDALEVSLRKLVSAGFTLRAALCGMSTVYSYTIGFVIEEQAVRPMPDELNPQYDLEKRNERIDPATHPLTIAAGEEILGNYDRRFVAGLEMIVVGMAKSLREPRTS